MLTAEGGMYVVWAPPGTRREDDCGHMFVPFDNGVPDTRRLVQALRALNEEALKSGRPCLPSDSPQEYDWVRVGRVKVGKRAIGEYRLYFKGSDADNV